ncbi:MAG: hypothetical protein DSM106950_26925 [Stigonema ocellatum SAG 48.90 = DSM 106950]|nr:hypothetical protein [Stigonema ocellatum SAG 48.90 = DSM 106950]
MSELQSEERWPSRQIPKTRAIAIQQPFRYSYGLVTLFSPIQSGTLLKTVVVLYS